MEPYANRTCTLLQNKSFGTLNQAFGVCLAGFISLGLHPGSLKSLNPKRISRSCEKAKLSDPNQLEGRTLPLRSVFHARYTPCLVAFLYLNSAQQSAMFKLCENKHILQTSTHQSITSTNYSAIWWRL